MLDIEIRYLCEKIEWLRAELYDIVDKKGLDSREAIRASQVLDEKMNEYYRLK